MILAAYLVTGFLVASVYAVGMLRGRRDRYHRLGLLIPLTVACIATPIQFAVGDTAARAIAEDQPIKFAAMECVQTTSTHVTEYIYGRCTADGVKGGIGIPGLRLVPGRLEHRHRGHRARHRAARGPAARQHDAALGLRHDGRHLHALIALGLWLGSPGGASATSRRRPGSCAPSPSRACLGRRARVRLDRDRGRPPAVDRLRGDAHRGRGHQAERRLGHVRRRAAALRALGAALVVTLRAMARRWRAADEDDRRALRARAAAAARPSPPRAAVSNADAVAGVLWVGVTAYAVFGGADFGAGFWSLVAGGGDRGRRARELIDWAIGPVWEANHVWLIFVLVVLWTGFSAAFEAIFSTLFIPLSLAALGIVLRGAGFAFHKTARPLRGRRLAERLFGVSSLLTPFFMGTVVGAIASGPGAGRQRDRRPVTSWLNPLSLLIGALFVATSAYLAAVFLVSDARRAGAPTSSATSPPARSPPRRRRARSPSAGIVALRADARYVYDGLTGDGLPLVILSLVCGAAVLVLLGAARAAAPARSRWAPSSPSSGAGASPSTPTCCRTTPAPSATLTERADRLRRRRRARAAVDRPAVHAGAARPGAGDRGSAAGERADRCCRDRSIRRADRDRARRPAGDGGGGRRRASNLFSGRPRRPGRIRDRRDEQLRPGPGADPWPNRLEDGSYEFDGTSPAPDRRRRGARDAIHGLVRWVAWTAGEREARTGSSWSTCCIPGPVTWSRSPWRSSIALRRRLVVTTAATNCRASVVSLQDALRT